MQSLREKRGEGTAISAMHIPLCFLSVVCFLRGMIIHWAAKQLSLHCKKGKKISQQSLMVTVNVIEKPNTTRKLFTLLKE